MKIIKPGEYKEPTYRFTCTKCGCVYECSKSEIKHEPSDGFYIGHDYTNCPTCDAHLAVDLYAEVVNG